MNSNTKFNDLTVVEHGLILKNGKKEKEISFSEIENIYIKVNKLSPICELGFILLPFFLIFLSVQYLALEKVMFLGLSTIIPVFVKINNYKSYGLRICLKDGAVFRKRVALNEKHDNISIVNTVRRKQLKQYTQINAPCQSEVLEFC
ncbi:MAG: hypothetical protein KAX81_05345 [Leadbetterella sp.]|nr:hypothetical protein [Leadbetterella sp.]